MSDIYLSITETPAVVTLSQPVVSGALSSTVTVANTVTVALDANSLAALESVTVTVGNVTIGSSVSISNFPATQVVSVSNLPASQVVTISNLPAVQSVSGTVTANIFGKNLNSPNVFQIPVIYFDEYIPSGGVVIPVQLTTDQGSVYSGNPLPISGAVTVGNSVTISSLPSISGTVTIGGFSTVSVGSGGILVSGVRGGLPSPVSLDFGSGRIESKAVAQYSSGGGFVDVSTSNALPVSQQGAISGTVTVSSLPSVTGTVTVSGVSSTVTARLVNPAGSAVTYAELGTAGSPSIDVLSIQGVSGGTSVPVSGTVTVGNLPSGALTTRFGSVTTAGTSQLTSCVTNTARKYLLVQNTSAATVTVGIGFSPTTTQGIQLASGASLTFESFAPTGAVWWLGGVTAAAWTILEG
jgi:hypothetical protein